METPVSIMDAANRLQRLGCPGEVFSQCAGISPSKFSRAVRGVVSLNGPEIITLLGVIAEFEGLAQDALPYPVNFKNAAMIGVLIDYRRSGVRFIPTTRQMEDLSEARP
jgi:hypothetical protein